LFDKTQPDLNWDNPEVREAVEHVMRFWLDQGVDGFRLDVINFISKYPGLPDDIKDATNGFTYPLGAKYYAMGPRLHEYLRGIGRVLKEYDAFSVGEMPFVRGASEVLKSVASDRGELAMTFIFEM